MLSYFSRGNDFIMYFRKIRERTIPHFTAPHLIRTHMNPPSSVGSKHIFAILQLVRRTNKTNAGAESSDYGQPGLLMTPQCGKKPEI